MFVPGKPSRVPQHRPFFGPLLRYDLVRSSRNGQQIGHRCFYAIVLLLVLALVYQDHFPTNVFHNLMQSASMPTSARAKFASAFFLSFMQAQFAMVLLITPLYTAGAIAEEKERRTLEFLFVTDLSNREIILGILGSRLSKLLLLILTGLPFLSLLEFLGGVDPNLLVAGFVATAMLLISLGSISILISVHAPSHLAAVVSSYLVMTLLAVSLVIPFLGLGVVVGELDSTANPFQSSAGLWGVLLMFCLVHGFIAALCCRGAIAQVRRQGLRQANRPRLLNESLIFSEEDAMEDGAHQQQHGEPSWVRYPTSVATAGAGTEPRRNLRPPVGADALIWKEIHYEPSYFQFDREQWLAIRGLIIFLSLLVCASLALAGLGQGEESERAVRTISTALCGIIFIIVALSAAGRMSRERQRQTLDDLLTLPVSEGSILFAKWLGSLLCVRWLWLGLVMVWVTGAAVGAIHFASLPFLLAGSLVYGAFLASLGLLLSTLYRTSLRASLFTLLVTLLIMIVPAVTFPAFTLTPQGYLNLGAPNTSYWSALFLAHGLSPTGALWALGFTASDLQQAHFALLAYHRIVMAIVGLHGYMAATVLLWLAARFFFLREKGPRPRQVDLKA